MKTIEKWKTAVYDGVTYEGFEVSNLGKIMNLNYNRTGKAELMNPSDNGDGYLVVHLSKNEETKKCYVHKLVAETFLPNPENKPQVNHKIEGDEGKKINMVIFNTDGSINKKKVLSNGLLQKRIVTTALVMKGFLKKQQTENCQKKYFNSHYQETSLKNGLL